MKQANGRVSTYIGLVVVFFIPLISNLLHYVVIEHEFGKRNHELEWVDGGKVHYCDQYLFKIHPAIEVPVSSITGVSLVLDRTAEGAVQEKIAGPTRYFYFNRGPPLFQSRP